MRQARTRPPALCTHPGGPSRAPRTRECRAHRGVRGLTPCGCRNKSCPPRASGSPQHGHAVFTLHQSSSSTRAVPAHQVARRCIGETSQWITPAACMAESAVWQSPSTWMARERGSCPRGHASTSTKLATMAASPNSACCSASVLECERPSEWRRTRRE